MGWVHRWMARQVLRSAERVFLSIPAWEPLLRGLGVPCPPMTWLPVPSNLSAQARRAGNGPRARRLAPDNALVVGSFGTYGPCGRLVDHRPAPDPGPGARPSRPASRWGGRVRPRPGSRPPHLRGRLLASGELTEPELAAHLAACDLLLQPYPDGASSRGPV